MDGEDHATTSHYGGAPFFRESQTCANLVCRSLSLSRCPQKGERMKTSCSLPSASVVPSERRVGGSDRIRIGGEERGKRTKERVERDGMEASDGRRRGPVLRGHKNPSLAASCEPRRPASTKPMKILTSSMRTENFTARHIYPEFIPCT